MNTIESNTDNLLSSLTQNINSRKAYLGKRFLAVLVDGIIAAIISFVLGIVSRPLGLLAAGAFLLTRDGLGLEFMKLRSFGKKAMKLRLVRNDGKAMNLHTSIMRNWPLAIGSVVSGLIWIGGLNLWLALSWVAGIVSLISLVEAVLVLVDKNSLRIGDKLAGTEVVEE